MCSDPAVLNEESLKNDVLERKLIKNTGYLDTAREVLRIERLAIEWIETYLNDGFCTSCDLILTTKGKVVVMGIGKSGHIGRKIAATLASTGTPAFFVHPGEASHGDLGMISKEDLVLALSNSGETNEILSLLPLIKRQGIPVIAMTGNQQSTLATLAEAHLCIHVMQEACPLGLAPTASTTAMLVMGDALAISLLDARGFTKNDFALSHPGGALGRKLLLRLSDVMRKKEHIPLIEENGSIKDALLEISKKGLGMTAVVNSQQELVGIFTDGDLRRVLDDQIDIHKTPIKEVMGKNPKTIFDHQLAVDGLRLMELKKINGLLVVNKQAPKIIIGALNMHDLLNAGVA